MVWKHPYPSIMNSIMPYGYLYSYLLGFSSSTYGQMRFARRIKTGSAAITLRSLTEMDFADRIVRQTGAFIGIQTYCH